MCIEEYVVNEAVPGNYMLASHYRALLTIHVDVDVA